MVLIKALHSEKDCTLDSTMESLSYGSRLVGLVIISLGLSPDAGSKSDLLSKMRRLLLLKGEEARELLDKGDLI